MKKWMQGTVLTLGLTMTSCQGLDAVSGTDQGAGLTIRDVMNYPRCNRVTMFAVANGMRY